VLTTALEQDCPTMKSRGPIDIQIWTPPIATAAASRLADFLRHKGSPWIEDIERRLAGTVSGATDYFYVALCEGQLVAHAWYTVASADPRLGLVGHIFTHPDHRQQGFASRLLEQIMRDFPQRGGSVMQLFTSTPHSVPFYERLGFENLYAGRVYHDTDWYMRYPVDSASGLDDLYAPPVVSQRRLSCADLSQYCLLYNSEHGSAMKDRAQRIGLGLEAELAFIESTTALSAGQGICVVAENGETIVGTATLMRSPFPYESHIGVFDYYVHSAHRAHAVPLSEACLASRREIGVELVYALAVDADKSRSLTELGFSRCGELPGHYRAAEKTWDAQLFRRE
jgi:GNAT superfamily N-acetyltransferase